MMFRVCVACGDKGHVESAFLNLGKCLTCGSNDTRHISRAEKRCCDCHHWFNAGRGVCGLKGGVALANERCEHWREK